MALWSHMTNKFGVCVCVCVCVCLFMISVAVVLHNGRSSDQEPTC